MLDRLPDLIDDLLNSEDRTVQHILLGVVVTAGAAILSSSLAARAARPTEPPAPNGARATAERPKSALGILGPAIFSATTLSALRIWNAPSGAERSAALRFWAAAQAVNGLWLALRPRTRSGQMLAAMTTAGVTAAYAHEARKLDRRAGVIASPHGRGSGLVNLVQEKLRLRPPQGATLH